MTAYYNEIDPYAAAWLRNLIAAGHIAAGDVDERSITDVQPDDIRGYTQCHFFARIGGWSLAMRLAGWPDDRSVWTGSCPCQPFSTAGAQRGSDDERHLWPAFFGLIRECRPASVFGEQVAGAAGLAWLDHVCADLEGAGYAAAAANLCAAGAGAPHIRQRLYWVADDDAAGRDRSSAPRVHERRPGARRDEPAPRSPDRAQRDDADRCGALGLLGNAGNEGLEIERRFPGVSRSTVATGARQAIERASPLSTCCARTAGIYAAACQCLWRPWRHIEWIECSDGKARPTQPGLFPLAHGVSNRVGRLRAYGNAIVPQVAATFVRAAA